MENFFDYVETNYTLSIEARRIIDCITIYANENMTDDIGLTEEGIDFIEMVIADNIGMDRQEIIDNWN